MYKGDAGTGWNHIFEPRAGESVLIDSGMWNISFTGKARCFLYNQQVRRFNGKPYHRRMRKLGRLIGYLKGTLGQHVIVEIPDSDWSGSKSVRRSTSSAIRMINEMFVLTSSRGQKSVSLSSAEAELNAPGISCRGRNSS